MNRNNSKDPLLEVSAFSALELKRSFDGIDGNSVVKQRRSRDETVAQTRVGCKYGGK